MSLSGEEGKSNEDLISRHTQRPRMELSPIQSVKPTSRYLGNLQELLLSDLLEEDPEIECANLKYITLQFLRLITPDKEKTQAMMRSRHLRGFQSRQMSKQAYNRMMLCRVVTMNPSTDGNKVVYLMQSNSVNHNLWNYYPNERDDGRITIGTIFRLVNVQPVEQEIGNVPVLKAGSPAIVMIPPSTYIPVPVLPGIQADDTKAFVYNAATLTVMNTTPFSTVCGGNFCDKQRCEEISQHGSKCGCWNMSNMRGNMVFGHNIKVKKDGTIITHNNFSSSKFTKLYVKGDMSNAIKCEEFQGTDAEIEIGNTIRTVVNHINSNGGWTVIGWYRRGTITDRVLMGSAETNNPSGGEATSTSGNVTFHIVSLLPTVQEVMNNNLEQMKFNVGTLSTQQG